MTVVKVSRASLNVVVAVGRLTRPAELRVLPSGDRLVTLELTVARDEGRAESLPVSWFAAPARAGDLDVDEQVVVVGRVRRRFSCKFGKNAAQHATAS